MVFLQRFNRLRFLCVSFFFSALTFSRSPCQGTAATSIVRQNAGRNSRASRVRVFLPTGNGKAKLRDPTAPE